jgi:hypothetical protein
MASRTFPTFPSIDFSHMPKVGLPAIDAEAVTAKAKDAGYIAVGLALLAVQKAQVRRQELRTALESQVAGGKSQLVELVDAVEAGLAKLDAQLITAEAKLDAAVESVEGRLPGKAGAALGQAHELVKVVRKQARAILQPAA